MHKLTFDALYNFAKSKPADEPVNVYDTEACVLAQYGRQVLGVADARGASYEVYLGPEFYVEEILARPDDNDWAEEARICRAIFHEEWDAAADAYVTAKTWGAVVANFERELANA